MNPNPQQVQLQQHWETLEVGRANARKQLFGQGTLSHLRNGTGEKPTKNKIMKFITKTSSPASHTPLLYGVRAGAKGRPRR
jgi:hypothetical protein